MACAEVPGMALILSASEAKTRILTVGSRSTSAQRAMPPERPAAARTADKLLARFISFQELKAISHCIAKRDVVFEFIHLVVFFL